MVNLMKYFTFIFQDLSLEDTPIWNFTLSIREMMDILHSSSLQLKVAKILQSCVEKYTSLRKELLSADAPKPKHHFLVHYANLIPEIGPLIYVWCMPYEAKHQQFSACAKNNRNYHDLSFPIANKHFTTLSCYFENNEEDYPVFCVGPCKERKVSELDDFIAFQKIVSNDLSQTVSVAKWITFNKTKYRIGNFIVNELLPSFSEIKHILYNPASCQS